MIPIAALLLLIIVAFSVAVVVSNPAVFELSIFGANIPVTTAGVYFTGAGAMLVLILAAALLRRGLKRDRARRRQVRALQNAAGVKSLPTTTRKPATPSGTKTVDQSGTSGQSGTSVVAPNGDDRQARPTVQAQDRPESDTTAGTTNAAERQALLDEAEELTGDGSDR